MSKKLTDEDFIAEARKACAIANMMYTATGSYLDEALQRLERATALIDDIKAHVGCGGVKHVGRIYSMIKEWEKQEVAVAEKSDDDLFVEHLSKSVEIVQKWPEWKRQMLADEKNYQAFMEE